MDGWTDAWMNRLLAAFGICVCVCVCVCLSAFAWCLVLCLCIVLLLLVACVGRVVEKALEPRGAWFGCSTSTYTDAFGGLCGLCKYRCLLGGAGEREDSVGKGGRGFVGGSRVEEVDMEGCCWGRGWWRWRFSGQEERVWVWVTGREGRWVMGL